MSLVSNFVFTCKIVPNSCHELLVFLFTSRPGGVQRRHERVVDDVTEDKSMNLDKDDATDIIKIEMEQEQLPFEIGEQLHLCHSFRLSPSNLTIFEKRENSSLRGRGERAREVHLSLSFPL